MSLTLPLGPFFIVLSYLILLLPLYSKRDALRGVWERVSG